MEKLFLSLAIIFLSLGNLVAQNIDSLYKVGVKYYNSGDYKSALPVFKEVAELKRQHVGETHRDYAVALYNVGTIYKEMGDNKNCLEYYL
ncbi:MAG: tetratricopeptide repeat protein, partial [Bacteroidales bacterium]|nr:tetratricopeptide repeat protein [Bacteroidales bacterium]